MIKAGEKLRETRLSRGLSLDDVSRNTKIKTAFLEHIEKGEYGKLPSVSYAYGFVRNYVKFLGLPEREIMAVFRREFNEDKAYRVLPKGLEYKQTSLYSKIRLRQTALLIVLITFIFTGYILFQYRYAFLNPPLTIISPQDKQVISKSEVKVIGKTDPNAIVYVEKNAVPVEQNGNFQKTLSVFPGIMVIDIKVINKFSKETDRKIQIDVKSSY
jgi:transcriptional regulator with XRE-family HTH domain